MKYRTIIQWIGSRFGVFLTALCLFGLAVFTALETPFVCNRIIDTAASIGIKTTTLIFWKPWLIVWSFRFSAICYVLVCLSAVYKNRSKIVNRLYEINSNTSLMTTLKFAVIILVGFLLRMLVMTLGHNYDFTSHLIVGKIVMNGGNVYAETSRYNYGPIFSLVLGLFYSCASLFQNQASVFRVFIVCFLTCFDIALAFLLFKKYKSLSIAALFFLNPVSVIITGFHNQFDVLAVFLGYAGCLMVNDTDESFTKQDFVSILLLSLSITTKHLLIFFPLWIFLNESLPKRKQMAYGLIPIAFFLVSFVPYLKNGYDGILANVFLYRSLNNFPLIHLFVKWAHLERFYIYCFVLLISVLGYSTRKMRLQDQILFYFLGLVCFSSAMTNQYLAIPLLSICILGGFFKHLYFVVVGAFLILSPNGLSHCALYPDNGLVWLFAGSMTEAVGFLIAAWMIFLVLFYRLLNPLQSLNAAHE